MRRHIAINIGTNDADAVVRDLTKGYDRRLLSTPPGVHRPCLKASTYCAVGRYVEDMLSAP